MGCEAWIGLVQEKDKCRAIVNAVMKLWAPYNAGSSFTS